MWEYTQETLHTKCNIDIKVLLIHKFPENLAKNTLMPNMLLLVDTKTEPFTLLENKKQTQTERGVSDINQCSNPANKCYKMKNVFL